MKRISLNARRYSIPVLTEQLAAVVNATAGKLDNCISLSSLRYGNNTNWADMMSMLDQFQRGQINSLLTALMRRFETVGQVRCAKNWVLLAPLGMNPLRAAFARKAFRKIKI